MSSRRHRALVRQYEKRKARIAFLRQLKALQDQMRLWGYFSNDE
jgi:hypothetical protein